MDGAWCDGLSACGADNLSELSDQLVSVQDLSAEQAAASDAVSMVSDVVSSLRRCGSAAGQCASLLSAASDVNEAARMRVLESVRGLSCDLLVVEVRAADEEPRASPSLARSPARSASELAMSIASSARWRARASMFIAPG